MKWFKSVINEDRNLLKKLFVFVSLLICTILAISFISLKSVSAWKISLESVYVDNVQPSVQLTDILAQSIDVRFRLLGVLADRLPATGSKKKIKERLDSINESWIKFNALLKLENLNQEQKELHTKLKSGKEEFNKFVTDAITALDKDDKDKIGDMIDNEWPAIITNFLNPLTKYQELQVQSIGQTYESSEKTVSRFKSLVIFFICLSVIVSISSIYFIWQFKNKSNAAIEVLKVVENGLMNSSQSVKSASDKLIDITNSNRQSVGETSSSLEEITNMVRVTSDRAIQSSEYAQKSNDSADRGVDVVERMLTSIQTINETINGLIEEMNQMGNNLKTVEAIFLKVQNKTQVINDIVFQTRLLSFNASVESARAGEHGKGFAVVAEEVGKLAQISGQAAAEISELITNGSNQISTLASLGQLKVAHISVEAKNCIDDGMQRANECSDSFKEIAKSLKQIQSLVEELSRSSNEQTIGVDEVNKAMLLISQSTEHGANLSTETQTISTQVEVEAQHLRKTVDNLVRLFNG